MSCGYAAMYADGLKQLLSFILDLGKILTIFASWLKTAMAFREGKKV